MRSGLGSPRPPVVESSRNHPARHLPPATRCLLPDRGCLLRCGVRTHLASSACRWACAVKRDLPAPEDLGCAYGDHAGAPGACTAQILRSVDERDAQLDTATHAHLLFKKKGRAVDRSIYIAYVHHIRRAQRFIYIENQCASFVLRRGAVLLPRRLRCVTLRGSSVASPLGIDCESLSKGHFRHLHDTFRPW